MEGLLALFLLLISYGFVQRLVQFLDPTLDASQVERSVALLAIPKVRLLEDLVLANDALLRACRQGLDVELALLGQVLEL